MDDWVVEDLFRRGSVVILAGESGTGKTWLVRDLCLSLARGDRWLGRYECDIGQSCYFMGEGSLEMIDRRDVGLLLGRGASLPQFTQEASHLLHTSCGSANATSFPYLLSNTAWKKRVEDTLACITNPEERPVCWAFDPLATMLEDADSGAGNTGLKSALTWCAWLGKASGATVILAHHLKKAGSTEERLIDRIRGDSNLVNLVDEVLVITGDPEDKNLLRVHRIKVKDSEGHSSGGPAFLIRRIFEKLSPEETKQLAELYGVDPHRVKPGSIARVRHLALDPTKAPQPTEEGEYSPAQPSATEYSEGELAEWQDEVLAFMGENPDGVSIFKAQQHLKDAGVGVGYGKLKEWIEQHPDFEAVSQKKAKGRGRPTILYRPLSPEGD